MIDLDQCACAGINLDKLVQPTILLLLAEQDLHGYGLIQRIMDSPMFKGEKPDPTGVYRFLKSMEERNFVISSWDLPVSGPPKKIYRITAEGMACLERWLVTLRDYLKSLQTLIISSERTLKESHRDKLLQDEEFVPVRDEKGIRQTS